MLQCVWYKNYKESVCLNFIEKVFLESSCFSTFFFFFLMFVKYTDCSEGEEGLIVIQKQ